jgi:glycosyltransferase involved in cell wall biosynthesis
MKLLLVANYAPDRQHSMLRFAELLRASWAARGGEVTVVAPVPGTLTRPLASGGGAAAKWAGYFDKYVRFPGRLRRAVRAAAAAAGDGLVVHVADHSNALYLPAAASPVGPPWVVTCHDLLAVRGALGEDTDCPASALGRQLQAAIRRGLGRAAAIACVSHNTQADVARLVTAPGPQPRPVIPLALNHPYSAIAPAEARRRLAAFPGGPWEQPFVLHVGSNLPRKNKAGVLRVFARLAANWPGHLVFAGPDLPPDLWAQAAAAGLAPRVFVLRDPDNARLEAAYSLAHALLFPSTGEGFGWPIIEAQACGCPVVCSDRTSLPEVGGDAARVHALADEAGMAESLRQLADPAVRAAAVARGRANLRRFDAAAMVDAHAALYEEVLAARRRR